MESLLSLKSQYGSSFCPNMAPKVYVALFAFLAVQGWTSAGVVSPLEVYNEAGSVRDIYDELYGPDSGDADQKGPLDCIKHIIPAYDTGKELRTLAKSATAYLNIVSAEFKRCVNLDDFEENLKCVYEGGNDHFPAGKELYEKFKVLYEKGMKILDIFDKCMG